MARRVKVDTEGQAPAALVPPTKPDTPRAVLRGHSPQSEWIFKAWTQHEGCVWEGRGVQFAALPRRSKPNVSSKHVAGHRARFPLRAAFGPQLRGSARLAVRPSPSQSAAALFLPADGGMVRSRCSSSDSAPGPCC